eukprot:COSAG01_NODE_21949_length_878_cov_1.041078_1_plen_170_part_00
MRSVARRLVDLEKAHYPELDILPFNSKNKFMATINRVGSDRVLFIKGAGEKILGMCPMILRSEGVQSMDERQLAINTDNLAAMAESGERVLGFAKVVLPSGVGDSGAFKDGRIASDVQKVMDSSLIFLGHFSLMDPAREEVPGAIHDCRTAGTSFWRELHCATAAAISH